MENPENILYDRLPLVGAYGYFADTGRMISIVRPDSLFPDAGNPVATGTRF
jgi:hypothetical protein